MSRSRRHIQIAGITRAKSEKDDKRRAAMTARKRVHDALKPHLAAREDFELEAGEAHPRSGQWTFAKDGKVYWRVLSEKDMRK